MKKLVKVFTITVAFCSALFVCSSSIAEETVLKSGVEHLDLASNHG